MRGMCTCWKVVLVILSPNFFLISSVGFLFWFISYYPYLASRPKDLWVINAKNIK